MAHTLKRIMLLAISILMVSALSAQAGNPIPSFNFHLKHNANFHEVNFGSGHPSPTDEKRDMNVSNDTPGGYRPGGMAPASIQVMIYRLDHSIVLGPFIIPAGETLTVPIDGNPWGVFVHSHHQTIVSVWTSKGL